jgi:hypothetical protein
MAAPNWPAPGRSATLRHGAAPLHVATHKIPLASFKHLSQPSDLPGGFLRLEAKK